MVWSATPSQRKRPPPLSARALVFRAIARGLRPDPVLTVTAWANAHRHVAAEASPYPGRWRTELVPYLAELMDCLSPSHPCETVTFSKSAQVAGTEGGINLIGMVADRAPAAMLVVLPTVDEAKKYNKVKLQPAIDATPNLKAKIREQKSRDDKGSTTLFKRFPGGYLVITGANSSAGLQMISVRYLIKEELSEWPLDVDGRGDPEDLAEKRLTAYREIGTKTFNNSTPGIKGMCRISKHYEASDQRRYFVPCPQCGHEQTLRWEQLRWSEQEPHGAHYVCERNGCVVEHHRKRAMVAAGRWIAQSPGAGRQPGFHINQLYSPFVSWDMTVAEWVKAKGDPVKEKVFTQQVLGEAYEAKGDAPDYLKLFARREPFRFGQVPPGVLVLVAGVDVQGDRLEARVWGFGLGKSSWLVDRAILAGDTSADAVWAELDGVLARRYASAWGRTFEIEAAAIDAGFNTQTVYAYVRRRGPRLLAVKGMPGHLSPPLGAPTKQDVSFRGEKLKGGVLLWPVGTWALKAETYAQLRKTIGGPREDGSFPPGYVHFGADVDENELQQVTAEFLVSEERRGYTVQMWTKKKDSRNEALDCRVYAAAAAVHLGLDRLSPADWAQLAAARGAPDAPQSDLFAPQLAPAAPATATGPAAPAPKPAAPRGPIVVASPYMGR